MTKKAMQTIKKAASAALSLWTALTLAAPTGALAQAARASGRAARAVSPAVSAPAGTTAVGTLGVQAPTLLPGKGIETGLPAARVVSLPQAAAVRPQAVAPAATPAERPAPAASPSAVSRTAPSRTPAVASPQTPATREAKAVAASVSGVRETMGALPDLGKASAGSAYGAGTSIQDAMTRGLSRRSEADVTPADATRLGAFLSRPSGLNPSLAAEGTSRVGTRVPTASPESPVKGLRSALPGGWTGLAALAGVLVTAGLILSSAWLPAALGSVGLLALTGTLVNEPSSAVRADDPAFQASVSKSVEDIARLKAEIGRVIVGQEEMVDSIIIALISSEHILLEGAPGVAKTKTVETFSQAVGGQFMRIQGTPDKMPSDILGSEVLKLTDRTLSLEKGPIFANIVLMDEINRTPPKTQAALLEAMQERQVTIGRQTLPLPKPFLLLATQNPIEQEGTYPLPEAQLDRFMFKVIVDHPEGKELLTIMDRFFREEKPKAQRIMAVEDFAGIRALAEKVHMDESLNRYIVALVRATHDPSALGVGAPGMVKNGASPRAAILLAKAARVQALLRGRTFVTVDDIRDIAPRILRHRILLGYTAGDRTTDEFVGQILKSLPVPAPSDGTVSQAETPAPEPSAAPAAESVSWLQRILRAVRLKKA